MNPIKTAAITGRTVDLTLLARKADVYAAHSEAENTRRSHDSQWRTFAAWCEAHGLQALPAEPMTLALYLAARADTVLTSSLYAAVGAVKAKHKAAGTPFDDKDPEFLRIWNGIRRTRRHRSRGKAALLPDDLRAMLAHCRPDLSGLRNRALLLFGFASAMRRSEIAALDLNHLSFGPEGVLVTIPYSKTDQYGEGQQVAVPYGSDADFCPVTALKGWLEGAGITEGAVFRPVGPWQSRSTRLSDRSIANVIKTLAAAAGLDPALYAGHSLRSGLATAAEAAGANLESRMRHLRHTKPSTTLRYSRTGPWANNAAKGVV